MRDYRKEQFISRFKNANISRTEAERKYKLKVEEEEELQRRMFEAMNSQAVQEALEAGGASAAVGGSTESFQVVGENILIYFRSETTLTYQVIAFNYTTNKISGPTDLGIDSNSSFYQSEMISGKGSLAFGESGDYVWYVFLDVNGSIIEKRIIQREDLDDWNCYNAEGKNLSFYHRKDGITYLKWWNSDSANINSCEIETGNGFWLSETSYDNCMSDGTINGKDDNGHYWSFLPNGEFYDITDSIVPGGQYILIERYSVYVYSNFYAVLYWDDDNGIYDSIRIIDNKGVILQDIDVSSYNLNDYNYGYYGDNKFYIKFWNYNDIDVPYYYVVYNGNTDTVITKEDSRGTSFESGIVHRNGYGSGYQDVGNRLTNGDVIIFAPDDGDDVGYDGNMDGYYYIKFHALIGDSDEFVTYEHENDGVESFRYRINLIYAGYPTFAVKQEDSDYIKLMIFKPSGAEFHATNLNYGDLQSNTLDVNTIGDNIWISMYNDDSGEWNFRLYNKNGTLLDELNAQGSVSWDISGSSAILQTQSNNKFYSVNADTPEFTETPSYYIHWDNVDTCVYTENGEYYSNFFAYGEGYQTETPGMIISPNGVSPEITLADTNSGTWSSWMTPNYAIWLSKDGENIYSVSVYALDGTLLQKTNLGVETINNSEVVGDRVFLGAHIDDIYRMWMVNGSEIQYTDTVTSSEAGNYLYKEYNDWPYDDC